VAEKKASMKTMQYGKLLKLPSPHKVDVPLLNQATITYSTIATPPRVGGSKTYTAAPTRANPKMLLCLADGGELGWEKLQEALVDSGMLDHAIKYAATKQSASPQEYHVTKVFTEEDLQAHYGAIAQERSRPAKGTTSNELLDNATSPSVAQTNDDWL
jgi:hypothetical protein